MSSPAAADRTFSSRFTTSDTGQITMIANTLLTCPDTESNCASARAGTETGNENSNNGHTMARIDTDGDASTFTSSSADLSLPADATVLFAGLYWGSDTAAGTGGQAAPTPGARNQVKLRVPGGTYQTLTADELDTSTSQTSRYQGFENVTEAVRAGGSGTYWVADVQSATGEDRHAGWSLVIAYRDPAAPPRNLTVFDGFQVVNQANPSRSIPVTGFLTPPTGPVRTRLGVIAYEGDRGSAGDALQLNASTITDALNPADNVFNSTIGTGGSRFTAKVPDYANQLGFDADLVNADNILGNNQSSATIRVTTAGETYFPGVVTFATELFAPDIDPLKSVTDVNGGEALPGDLLEYTVELENTGGDAANQLVLTDVIPANASYEPGTLSITAPGPAAAQTDAPGDDRAEYDAGTDSVRFRLGTGANATAGGALAPGASTTVTFRVRIDSPLPEGTIVANQASASFFAATTGVAFTDVPSNETQTPVRVPDLVVAKAHTPPGPFVAGGTATFQLSVSNQGDGASRGTVTVTDTLDPSFSPQNVLTGGTGAGWTCSLAVQTVTCTRSDSVPAGEAYPPISIPVTVSGSPPPDLSNTTEVSGGSDGDPSNNTATDSGGVLIAADVGIAKSVSPQRVRVGEQATYMLTVTNNGPATATGVTVDDDPLPAGLTLVSVTPSQGTCSGAFTCDVGTLAATESATITAVVEAGASAVGTAVNTAGVSADQPDPLGGNDSATSSLDVAATADLGIDKTGSPTPPVAGEPYTYTITVDNEGPQASTGSVVTDVLPDGFDPGTPTIGGAGTGTCAITAGTLRCELGALGSGEQATITVPGTLDPNLGATMLANSATVAGNEEDPDPDDNDVQTSVLVTPAVDLQLTKTTGATGELAPGDEAVFDLLVENLGPSDSTGSEITDQLPAGLEFVSATGGCVGSASSQTVTCPIGTLAAGGSLTRQITARVVPSAAGGTLRNVAEVHSTVPDERDPSLSNNSDVADVSVQPRADLAITKDVSSPTVVAGESITYTLAVTNGGPNDATGVSVEDDLSAGLELVSATPSSGSCTQATPVVCDIGDVAAGGTAQIVIRARASGQAGQTLQNHAAVAGDQFDPEPGNNEDDAPQVTVVAPPPSAPPPPDLVVTKEASTTTPVENEPVTYTITVENRGQGAATGVRLTDTPSAEVEVRSVSASQGTCASALPIVCELGTIAPGARVTVTTVLIPRDGGRLANTATVTSAGSESAATLGNNEGGTAGRVRAARTRLSVTKRASRRSASPGDHVSYRIRVGNRGENAARNVRVCDGLPSGLAFVSARGARFSRGRACWRVPRLAAGRGRSFRVVAVAANVLSARRAVNRVRVTGSNAAPVRGRAAVRLLPGARRVDPVTG